MGVLRVRSHFLFLEPSHILMFFSFSFFMERDLCFFYCAPQHGALFINMLPLLIRYLPSSRIGSYTVLCLHSFHVLTNSLYLCPGSPWFLRVKPFLQQKWEIPLLVILVARAIFSLVLLTLPSILGITVNLLAFDVKVTACLGFLTDSNGGACFNACHQWFEEARRIWREWMLFTTDLACTWFYCFIPLQLITLERQYKSSLAQCLTVQKLVTFRLMFPPLTYSVWQIKLSKNGHSYTSHPTCYSRTCQSPSKKWSLSPLPSNLGGSCDTLDEDNIIEVTLNNFWG